jgi:hypothetical protein
MKKLSLKPEDLQVESFGTLPPARARGTVRGAIYETYTCPDTQIDCPDTQLDCPDTYNPSCPRTCGIVIAPAAYGGDAAVAPGSWDCLCM